MTHTPYCPHAKRMKSHESRFHNNQDPLWEYFDEPEWDPLLPITFHDIPDGEYVHCPIVIDLLTASVELLCHSSSTIQENAIIIMIIAKISYNMYINRKYRVLGSTYFLCIIGGSLHGPGEPFKKRCFFT